VALLKYVRSWADSLYQSFSNGLCGWVTQVNPAGVITGAGARPADSIYIIFIYVMSRWFVDSFLACLGRCRGVLIRAWSRVPQELLLILLDA
jgi:hypothetical protein